MLLLQCKHFLIMLPECFFFNDKNSILRDVFFLCACLCMLVSKQNGGVFFNRYNKFQAFIHILIVCLIKPLFILLTYLDLTWALLLPPLRK